MCSVLLHIKERVTASFGIPLAMTEKFLDILWEWEELVEWGPAQTTGSHVCSILWVGHIVRLLSSGIERKHSTMSFLLKNRNEELVTK